MPPHPPLPNLLKLATLLSHRDRAVSALPESGSGWVLNALQAAFYTLLKSEKRARTEGAERALTEGISATIGLGADTDTNAAICGALLGATYGLTAIPLRWQREVLSARPSASFGRGSCHRPKWLWSCDALHLTEALLRATPRA